MGPAETGADLGTVPGAGGSDGQRGLTSARTVGGPCALRIADTVRRPRAPEEDVRGHRPRSRPGGPRGRTSRPRPSQGPYLWFPYRVADGVWRGSAPSGPEGGRVAVPRSLLHFWWALWIASLLTDRITDRLAEGWVGPDGLGLLAGADALEIVSAVVAILFVRTLTRMQVDRAAQPLVPAPPVPGAHR
ncbi:DUF4328 domain-containing protein [Streptomyces sp. NPDC006320]|uniref:DUF4328 domain-containing protein n=1 Tax=Streptomyces sp. NPDC006320 TaxID=3156750 RepID=UPI0033BB1E40